MPRGGARNRSGPPLDPTSGRSERRGVRVAALPTSYDGPVPDWPLPAATPRELTVWAESWCTPQANAWAMPAELWRVPMVALWVRTRVRCEDREAPAALFAQLHRLADQVGMTTAGLREMGWAVAQDELAVKVAESEPDDEDGEAPRRLSAVPDA